MTVLKTTLLSDGSSDRALLPVLDWLLQCKVTRLSLERTQWVDWRNRKFPPQSLEEKIRFAVEYYPSDLLFIHRDAEAQDPESRRAEIGRAMLEARISLSPVCVVPVRMTEAWLLLDEMAIREAAGNPGGRVNLNLPSQQHIENTPDPKETLFTALRTASEHTGRRLKSLQVEKIRHRVAERMDYELLRNLPAFQSLETELETTLAAGGWA
jgi:hypothetical protein